MTMMMLLVMMMLMMMLMMMMMKLMWMMAVAVVPYLRIAQDTCDSHDTETQVGHLFGAAFATLAVPAYDT